jgi:RNA polymerase-associated protein
MSTLGKRSVMTLYSASDIESHRTRIVMAEKGILHDHIEIDRIENFEDLLHLNPYNTVPTLVDRDLVLYQSPIIMEYLDERFPHPPLLPVYPVARAKFRILMHRIENDWYPLAHNILEGDDAQARKELEEVLLSVNDVFKEYPYFMSEEFTLVDCSVAPILWRLPLLGIGIPKQAKALLKYAERLFARDSFQNSLTEAEREIRL